MIATTKAFHGFFVRATKITVAAMFSMALLLPAAAHALPPVATVTTLTITAAGNAVTSVAPGTPVTLTAAVTTSGAAVHPGTVKFCNATAARCLNGAVLGTAQLTAAGTASILLRLPSGPHSFTAVFAGTTASASSTSSVANLTVTGTVPTATTLAFSGVTGNYSLTSKVTSVNGYGMAISGTVSFKDATNGTVLSSAALGGSVSSSTLSLKSSTVTNNAAYNLAVGDFNGDGIPDVVLGDYYNSSASSATMSVLLGNGDGTFTSKTQLSLGTANGTGVPVVGDFNGDGKLDFAVLASRTGDSYSTAAMFIFLATAMEHSLRPRRRALSEATASTRSWATSTATASSTSQPPTTLGRRVEALLPATGSAYSWARGTGPSR